MNNSIAVRPKISEKTYALSELTNTYVFEIPYVSNKHTIAHSVAAQYDVTVIGVRIASIPGKVKRSTRKGGRKVVKGSRSDIRKAYVTLAEGDKLPISSAIEDADTQPEVK